MNSPIFRRLFLLVTLLVLCSAIAVGIYTRASRSQKQSKNNPRTYDPAKVTDVPEVRSGIEGLEITSVSLINQGTPEAALNIDITNKRNEDVMALDFIAGKSTYGGLAMDGLLDENAPRVIIPRHSLKTFTWTLGSILEGETIYIGAAVFSDGKEEGNRLFLSGLKKSREKYQQKRREEKARNGGQQ